MEYVLFGLLVVIIINFCIMFWANNENTKLIYRNLKKNREMDQVKQAQVENLAREILKANLLVVDNQSAIVQYMDALSDYLEKQKLWSTKQQGRFTALAKSDMMSARRDELIRCRELKVALERLVSVSTSSRQPPSPNDMIAIDALTNRIKELESIVEGD